MGEEEEQVLRRQTGFEKFFQFWVDLVVKPVEWVRENVMEPNRKEYYWYHERLRRVPTVDKCYTDDYVCVSEAQKQFLRDRMVDKNIVKILKKRYEYCAFENSHEKEVCLKLRDAWQNALTNYFIKYGELGMNSSVLFCYMKQKHRMAFERRHGPVGSGRKIKEEEE